MQVKLYTLRTLCLVFTLFHGARHHGEGFQHQFVIIAVQLQSSLHLQYRANLHIVKNRFCFTRLQEAVNPDTAVMIRHIETDDPRIAFFQFLMLHRKDFTLYDDAAHIQIQFLHGHHIATERFAVECFTLGRSRLFLLLGRCYTRRPLLHQFQTHGIHGIKQRLSFQHGTCFNTDRYRHREPFTKLILHNRHTFFQFLLSVSKKFHRQVRAVPFPPCTGKATAVHGI